MSASSLRWRLQTYLQTKALALGVTGWHGLGAERLISDTEQYGFARNVTRQHGAHEIKSPLLPPSYALIRSGSTYAAGPAPTLVATSGAGIEQSRTAGPPGEAGTAPNTAHRYNAVQESFERVSGAL